MRPIIILTAALILITAGCGSDQEPIADHTPSSMDGLAATWKTGSLSLEDVENHFAAANGPACREARHQAGGGSLDELVPCYEEIARDLAMEAIVRAANPDIQSRVLEGDDDETAKIRRATYEQVFRERLSETIDVSETEVRTEYESDPEKFRQPGSVQLMNIFRRHDDPANPEATDALLRELAARFEAGETWEELARRYSQSETRERGGFVGTVARGRLPTELEEVVFDLAPGAVSEPVRVRGGSVIFHVRMASQDAHQSFDEVRSSIAAELRIEKTQAAIATYVAGEEPPGGSTILAADEILTALDDPDPDTVVLAIGENRVTAAQLRGATGLKPMAIAAELGNDERAKILDTYLRTKDQMILPFVVMRRGDQELVREVEKRLSDIGTRMMINRIIIDELTKRVESDTDNLRTYWQDNRQHFLTPLRYHLRFWRLPFGADPVSQHEEMERYRQRLVSGELVLETAAAELGGTIDERGWIEHAVLTRQLPAKAVVYLAELGDSGYTVPYQQADSLHLIQLVDREEPTERSFEDARADVVTAYIVRHRQELYRQLATEHLEAADFRFFADEVRADLTRPF